MGNNEKPIIFSAKMVKAILDGKKTQTRRVVKPLFLKPDDYYWHQESGLFIKVIRATLGINESRLGVTRKCPHGQEGDSNWVRETFFYEWPGEDAPKDMKDCRIVYRADEPNYITSDMREYNHLMYRWTPSIFMPRWASRITSKITEVRAERLQEISANDCLKEGIRQPSDQYGSRHVKAFQELWDSINKKKIYGWDANPFVWVITFERITE